MSTKEMPAGMAVMATRFVACPRGVKQPNTFASNLRRNNGRAIRRARSSHTSVEALSTPGPRALPRPNEWPRRVLGLRQGPPVDNSMHCCVCVCVNSFHLRTN